MKVEEIKPRASEGDTIELEGKVSFARKPNSNDFEGTTVWSQFIVLKDDTGEQGAWLKLDSPEDKVTKGTSIRIKGKLGEEYEDKKGVMKRSVNNCEFEGDKKAGVSQEGSIGGNGKEDYWTKKFEWEKKRDIRNQLTIARECAFKAATELVCAEKVKEATFDKIFTLADKIRDHYLKDQKITSEDITRKFGGTKEERIEEARGIVGETEFKPASTKQKNIIFGYTDKEGKYHKGMIDSRYIETHEIKKIGDPKKMSVDEASEWISFWWGEQGDPDDIGAKKQREIDNPRDENGKLVNALVKGDKTSLVKDILVDEINALRRENRLNDDVKFKEEMGYNPKLKELSEEELLKLKELLKYYHPKNWDEEEK